MFSCVNTAIILKRCWIIHCLKKQITSAEAVLSFLLVVVLVHSGVLGRVPQVPLVVRTRYGNESVSAPAMLVIICWDICFRSKHFFSFLRSCLNDDDWWRDTPVFAGNGYRPLRRIVKIGSVLIPQDGSKALKTKMIINHQLHPTCRHTMPEGICAICGLSCQ